MATGTERATVNQIVQIGMESTPGTTVAATKLIQSTDVSPGIKLNSKSFRAGGRKYPYLTVPGREWVEAKLDGPASYNELSYWLSSVASLVSTATHSGGTLSKDWVITPALTGNSTIQTFTVEKGDSIRAMKFGYGLLTGISLDYSRDAVDFSGNMIGQRLSDNITLTASGSVTAIAKQPILGSDVNWYIDTTAGGIKGTQASNVVKATFDYSDVFGTYWPMVRTNTSFAKHIDLAPKATLKLEMEADSVGMSPLSGSRIGSTFYIVADAQGQIIEGSIPYQLELRMACQVASIEAFGDEDGVYKIGWNFNIIEDTTLAYAWKATVVNQLATL